MLPGSDGSIMHQVVRNQSGLPPTVTGRDPQFQADAEVVMTPRLPSSTLPRLGHFAHSRRDLKDEQPPLQLEELKQLLTQRGGLSQVDMEKMSAILIECRNEVNLASLV